MILGLGTDVVDLERIRSIVASPAAERFVSRVLCADEQEVFRARADLSKERGAKYLASRYAGKEAFSKAMGSGVGAEFSFQDLSILNGQSGQPVMVYSPKLQEWLEARGAQAHVSLSDERNVCMATVIISSI
ncbi:MAG: holo-ACP synthase [Limnobacter sp.]|nr:holo-ACP synthase [Limnobacter sp.]